MRARILLCLVLSVAPAAHAFEPFTHNFTGDEARRDALDGFVTIDGREYPVRSEVVQALRDWPQFYDAGVIGPDIYPDLLYGWNLIHTSDGGDLYACESKAPAPPIFEPEPEAECTPSGDTGEWLALVLGEAWKAQDDPRYSDAEKAQILAFSYGFLTHPAGDMWAHTLVNDFAAQLWPPLGEVLTDPDALAIALRHKAVEAYIGDATPFYDGNPDRTILPDGDVSDSETPHRAFDAPHRFMFEIMIDPNVVTPADPQGAPPGDGATREATIGFFLDLRRELVRVRDSLPPRPIIGALAELITEHDRIDQVFQDAADECAPGEGEGGFIREAIECVNALAALAAPSFASRADYLSFREGKLGDSSDGILARYIDNWIGHIDEGLAHWGELSLALNRAYFDPQVRRDLQNRPSDPGCGSRGPDTIAGLRADCEHGVSSAVVIIDTTNDFVNDYLLAMLGAPPLVGDVRRIRQQFQAKFDEAVGKLVSPALLVLNPLIATVDAIRDDARERILEKLSDRFGIDVDDIEEFSHGAAHWLDLETVSITTPGLGTQTFNPLFQPGDHAQVDALTGVPESGHHVPQDPPNPNGGGLTDGAAFDPVRFAPLANTITLAKLLLLDGATLDRALGEILVERGVRVEPTRVRTYQSLQAGATPANVMIEALSGTPWLRSITSDHSWRYDAQGETFFDFPHVRGGTGQFPLWESCVLRPTFRVLFDDWENALQDFPDLGDVPSPDPASDPEAPQVALAILGRTFDDGTTRYVDHAHALTLSATDGAGFALEHVALRYRVRAEGAEPGEFVEAGPEATFTIEGPDGPYLVEYQSQDPCHTFADEGAGGEGGDPLPPGALQTVRLTLAMIGTEGNDRMTGTNDADIILGLGGNDRLLGRRGADELHGGPGRDALHGGDGDDVLYGDDDDDRIVGGPDDDLAYGGPGNDRLRGAKGSDALFGEDGNDMLRGGAHADQLDGGPGPDRLKGGPGTDACAEGDGADERRSCESVY